jgi:hypothetical protein
VNSSHAQTIDRHRLKTRRNKKRNEKNMYKKQEETRRRK